MLTLIVYQFEGVYYLAYFGESQHFKTKADVLRSGLEKEIFTIVHLSNTSSYLDTLKQLITEAEKRGINDIRTDETVRAIHGARSRKGSKSVN